MSALHHIGDYPWPGTAPMQYWPPTYTVPAIQYSITIGQTTVTAPTADEVLRLARLAGLLA